MNTKIMADAPKIIKDFLGYMQTIKGKSPKTVDEYYLDLRTFLRFIKLSKNLVFANTYFNEININDVNIDLIKQINLSDINDNLN